MNDETRDTLGHLDTVTRSSVIGVDPTFEPRVPGFTILAHPETRRIGECSTLLPLTSGQPVELSRLVPLFAQPGDGRRKPLADPHLSRRALRIEARVDGGIDVFNEPRLRVTIDGDPLADRWHGSADDLHRGIVLLLADRIVLLLHWMDVMAGSGPTYGLVGESREIHALRQQISRVADLAVPVLLRGETGTGKEMVARGLHQASSRRSEAFIAVNMGAIPSSLAAAELFGSVKGAFTGAERRRHGYFTQADRGTLFLDEIGETPGEVQALLLRTLETGIVQPVGAEKAQAVDVRVLAATDADLESAIEAGRFRAPLLHRLSGYEIRLPPLRERRDDIGRLLLFFLRRELDAIGEAHRLDAPNPGQPWLPGPLVARLAIYSWPGNVRQLRNVARQLVIANRGAVQLSAPPELDMLLASEVSPRPDPFENDADAELDRGDTPVARAETPPVVVRRHDSSRPVLRTLVAIRWTRDGEVPSDDRSHRLDRNRQNHLVRSLLADYDGLETAKRDGFLLVFERPIDAVGLALEVHQATIEDETPWSARIGIAFGEVRLRHNTAEEVARGAPRVEVEGPSTHTASHLAQLASRRQILLNRGAHDLARQAAHGSHPMADDCLRWLHHGTQAANSTTEAIDIFEVGIAGQAPFAAPDELVALDSTPPRPSYRSPGEIDEADLLDALRRHAFRLLPTAKALGISRTSLYALIDRSPAIRKARDLEESEILECQQRHNGDLDAMAAELEVSRKGLSRRMTELGI